MAQSEADICNIALLRVGHKTLIDDLEESNQAARACKVLFTEARDSLLATAPWAFATQRADLAVVEDAERTGWEYAYALPADCITPINIYPGTRNPSADVQVPFKLEYSATSGQLLLTDMEDAELLYVARVEEIPLYPPLFVEALAWKLASDLALVLPVKPQVGLAMQQGFERALTRAAAVEFRKGLEDQPPQASYIRAR